MPLDTFAPTFNPSRDSTQLEVDRRVNKAQFGDGYSQRSGDGLNASPRIFNASWSSLQTAEADTLEAFFDAHKVTPFLWTLPLESVERKWTAGKSRRGYLGGSVVSFSCPLEEVFDL